jgi:hypothetical protein
MPAHKLSAKTRASRENIKKARDARKQQAIERRLETLAASAKSLDEKIAGMKELVPQMTEDKIIAYLENQPKKNLVKWFKDILFKVFDEAGGMERLKRLARQDKIFLKLVDQLLTLSKSDTESKQPTSPKVIVNITGLYPEKEKDMAIEITPPAITPQQSIVSP